MKQWNLKRLRDEMGVTQAEIADALGMGFHSYQRKENGVTPFIDVEMHRISLYFNLSMDEIFLFKDCNDIAIK